MEEEMKNDANVKALLEELGHVLWAADHPMMMLDRSIVDLLRRCGAALRTMSERPGEEDFDMGASKIVKPGAA